jgi:hypothetical protein
MHHDPKTDAAGVLPDGVLFDAAERPSSVGTHTVALERPVKHGTRELLALEFLPLSGAHVRRCPRDWAETSKVLEFAGQLTGLPDSVFDQLIGADVGEVIRATLTAAWPMLDLPVQWEAVWKGENGAAPARTLPKFPGGCTLKLERAVSDGRDTLASLEFGELTGKMARTIPTAELPVSKLPWLVEQLTGAPGAVVDKLTGRDLNRALALAQLFFLAIRGTGATSG